MSFYPFRVDSNKKQITVYLEGVFWYIKRMEIEKNSLKMKVKTMVPIAQSKRRKLFAMNPVILILGLVSLFTDLSSNMIIPILPLYLTSVLHVQVQSIGIIEGIAESTASILKLFSGWITDRAGKYRLFMFMDCPI